ncbi:hypothetical protein [Chromobacterium violaceum]|uniref:hypothetical protein n=1 Tax=Chromobacterium violaceum TaxID=536 RepID=UPI00111C46A6|nr:hypothetical protein [Chromobacterium violaceum]
MDALEERLQRIEKEIQITLGRLNAVQATISVVNGTFPPDWASTCLKEMREAFVRIEADLIASNLPQEVVNEMIRVMNEQIQIFSCISSSPRHGMQAEC